MKKTKIIKINPEHPEMDKISQAAEILKTSGLVAFPTETVYGLAALVPDSIAVEKLRLVKTREESKKFSVCIFDVRQAEEFYADITPFAWRLINRFWPGPLTLVMRSKAGEFIGLRMPKHPVASALLRVLKNPVFAPSANLAGNVAPVCAEDVLRDLDGKIDAVIDSGRTKIGISSTVCKVDEDKFEILRPGAVSETEIKEISLQRNVLFVCTGNSCRSPMAEGMMKDLVKGNKYINVSSAGVAAFDGMPATEQAVEAMRRRDIDISAHRARRLSPEMVKESDYIVVMEPRQRNYVLELVKSAQGRVFLLKEFSAQGRSNGDTVNDPIGRDLSCYENTAAEIKELLKGLVGKIK